jgi:hypothetical protein
MLVNLSNLWPDFLTRSPTELDLMILKEKKGALLWLAYVSFVMTAKKK